LLVPPRNPQKPAGYRRQRQQVNAAQRGTAPATLRTQVLYSQWGHPPHALCANPLDSHMTWIMTSQECRGLGLCGAHTGLEKALGGPLFERHSRGVTPTALVRLSHT